MHTFRTVLDPTAAPFQIDHSQHTMLLGSCFTEHIGQALAARKFKTLANPFGIVYNPLSMVHCLKRLLAGNQAFEANNLFQHAGLWHSWEHHGRFSHPDQAVALDNINTEYYSAAAFLKKTDVLLLTFGTAAAFVLQASGQLVANNHKMPAALFESKQGSVSEIVDQALSVLQQLQATQPSIQVVLTVSPVRHLRNGLVENQRSKATLILACAEICQQMGNVHYFPAYELLMDDLRDYRFYGPDMIHPSPVAVDYVWQAFAQTFFSDHTRRLNERIEKIQTAVQHRPFHTGTAAHQAFLRAQLESIQTLKKEAPLLDFEPETAFFKAQLGG